MTLNWMISVILSQTEEETNGKLFLKLLARKLGLVQIVTKCQDRVKVHTHSQTLTHIPKKIRCKLTCLLPTPLQKEHELLWSLWGHTSQSSELLQILFVSEQTAKQSRIEVGIVNYDVI